MSPHDIVRNPSTPSSADEHRRLKLLAESEARRAYDAQVKRFSKAAPDETRFGTVKLGGIGSHAVVVLEATNRDGSIFDWIICDLSVEDRGLVLVMVCPRCIHRLHRSVTESHITLRSWHRGFSLDGRRRGELWVNPKPPHEHYTLAGTIYTHEPQTCPVCSFRFEIDNGKVKVA